MDKKVKKKIKKAIKKTNKTILISVIIFFVIGAIIGFSTTYILTRNDTFELIGEKNITLSLNEEYKEEGVKAISFGMDLKDKVEIETNLDTSIEGEYTVIYTIKSSFRYKNVKRVRYVNVVTEGDNNG